MRVWRSPTGFIADLGPTSEAVVSSLAYELPEGPWRDLHEFASVHPDGTVRERYRVTVWSLDDDLGVSTHAVIDGELRNLTVVVGYRGRVRREEQAVVSGLVETSDATFVKEAVVRHEGAEKEALERVRAERSAKVGPLKDFNLDDSFRRAQLQLWSRVEAYGDDLCIDLLRALDFFGRLHPTRGNDPAFLAALEAFVAACRFAAFDPETPAVADRPGVEPRPFPELQDRLSRLETRLLGMVASQEECDALLNASEYRKAAVQVGRALSFLRPSPLS